MKRASLPLQRRKFITLLVGAAAWPVAARTIITLFPRLKRFVLVLVGITTFATAASFGQDDASKKLTGCAKANATLVDGGWNGSKYDTWGGGIRGKWTIENFSIGDALSIEVENDNAGRGAQGSWTLVTGDGTVVANAAIRTARWTATLTYTVTGQRNDTTLSLEYFSGFSIASKAKCTPAGSRK